MNQLESINRGSTYQSIRSSYAVTKAVQGPLILNAMRFAHCYFSFAKHWATPTCRRLMFVFGTFHFWFYHLHIMHSAMCTRHKCTGFCIASVSCSDNTIRFAGTAESYNVISPLDRSISSGDLCDQMWMSVDKFRFFTNFMSTMEFSGIKIACINPL